MHGRAAFQFAPEDIVLLRRHLEPGGGTLFADAACGSPAFDAAFRKFVATMLPDNPLVPIPRDDELYTRKVGFDLDDAQYSKAAGGGRDFPTARRRQAERALGDHLLEIRPGLRP